MSMVEEVTYSSPNDQSRQETAIILLAIAEELDHHPRVIKLQGSDWLVPLDVAEEALRREALLIDPEAYVPPIAEVTRPPVTLTTSIDEAAQAAANAAVEAERKRLAHAEVEILLEEMATADVEDPAPNDATSGEKGVTPKKTTPRKAPRRR